MSRSPIDSESLAERLQAELAELREREARYRGLFESMLEGCALAEIILDAAGRPHDYRFLEVNPAFGQMTGFPPERANGRTARELFPGIEPCWIETFGRVALSGEPARFEEYAAGLGKWFEVFAFRTAPDRFAHLFVDITERKRAEQRLRESERSQRREAAELEALYRNAPVGLCAFDTDLRYVRINERLAEINGLPVAAHSGRRFGEVVPERAAAAEPLLRRVIETGEPLLDVETEGETAACPGVRRYWREHYWPIRDARGQVVGINVVAEEVTERKRIEVQRQEQLRFLRNLLDAIPVPVFYKDAAGVYLGCNTAFENYLGLPRERIIGQTVYGIAPKHLADVYRQADDELLARGGLQVYESRVRYGDGSEHDVIFYKSTFAKGDGGIGGLVGTILDITERKRLEELRLREQEFRAVAENSPDIIVRFDRDLHHLYMNPAGERIRGVSCEAVIGKTLRETGYPEESAAFWEERVRRAFAASTAQAGEFRLDGRWFELQAVPEHSEDGRVATVLAIAREITERKQAEETLRAAIAYNRSLIEASLDPLVTIGPTGLITDVNRATEAVTGLSRGELIGTDFSDYFTEPERARAGYEQVFREGWVRDYPLELRHRDGHTTSVLYNATVYRDAAGEVAGVFAAARDITARKRAEQELRALNEELQRTLRELRATQERTVQSEKLAALGTMAAGVAHELNNPLMAVMNYVSFAQRKIDHPQAEEALARGARELERMRELIKGMVAFVLPVEGPLTAVEVPRQIERVVALLETDLKARQIAVATYWEMPLPAALATAPGLQQVLLNLLLNARDAVQPCPVRRITIRAWSGGDEVFVAVDDTGTGIPAAVQGRIFDPFFTTKPPGGGTGLGLPVSRRIIDDFGGELSFTSREGAGSSFLIRLKPADAPQTRREGPGA